MTPDAIPLSIFIITRNEADRIGRTLVAAKKLASDIVVVDSHSTDATRDIAEAMGVRVVTRDFTGYGDQKRFAEEQCRHPWLLNLDADEVMPDDLIEEIRSLFAAAGGPAADAYGIPIAEIFPGEDKPHPLAYALAPVRLYRFDKGRYSPSPVHDRVDLVKGARVKKLKGVIHHFSVRSIGDQLAKLNIYSDRQADDLEQRGENLTVLRLFLEFPAAFIKAYIGRRHALRGVYGFMTAMNYAFFRYLRVAKHFERRIEAQARRNGASSTPSGTTDPAKNQARKAS